MNITIKDFCSMIEPQEDKEYFDIPTIQRGFVWKPYQIENLWDSLARNFPIGTFTIDDSSKNKQILDGQQRASAIVIGYKGIAGNTAFNIHGNFMRLFVDIAKPSADSEKKFTFRLITRSHPWGYQLKDNDEMLSVADRRNVLKVYDELGITESPKNKKERVKYFEVEEKKTEFFPYDCYLPIPVEMFLQAEKKEDCFEAVKQYTEKTFNKFIEIQNSNFQIKCIPFLEFYEKELGENKNAKFFQKETVSTKGLLSIYENIYQQYKKKFGNKNIDPQLNKIIESHFADINEKIYHNEKWPENDKQHISFYTLDELYDAIAAIKNYQLVFSNITNTKLNISIDSTEEQKFNKINKNNNDDIDIIFQRLNRGGTPITEDDLIFSLFKSSLGKSKDDLELLNKFVINCGNLINPSRLFRLAYLLFLQVKRNNIRNELKYQSLKYKYVKHELKDEKFKGFLKDYFIELNDKNLFVQFKKIFLYDKENNKAGLPIPLFIKLCNSAPELVFLMMYRLSHKCDYEHVVNSELNRKLMIGFLLGLFWFYKGKKEKSYRPLLQTIWPLVSSAEFKDCWSTELLQRCNLMYDDYDFENFIFNKTELYNANGKRDTNVNFIDKILDNKDLVLYAQKDALATWFDLSIFLLDDNAVPYDYDHICPSSYRRKRNIHKDIKLLLDDIGNFRVWPFDLNRSDQDKDIAAKFYFDKTNIFFEQYNIKDKKVLLQHSFIKWKVSDYVLEKIEGIKRSSTKNIDALINDIKDRSKAIYNVWYILIKDIFKRKNINNGLEYDDDSVIENLNNIVRERYKNVWIKLNDDNCVIVNDNIFVTCYDREIFSEQDNEATPMKTFYFTLASYSKVSFEHLCEEICMVVEEYNSNPPKYR